jgi:hypothetical protein
LRRGGNGGRKVKIEEAKIKDKGLHKGLRPCKGAERRK